MKKTYWLMGIILLLLFVLVITNWKIVFMLFGNWFGPKASLSTSKTWEGGNSYEYVPYSEISESDYLHLYVPDSEKPLPLYIMVHGGGFFMNDLDSRQAQLFYQYVRDQGYAVATINYRLGDEAKYPAAIEDVKAAVRFLRAHADEYGLDPTKFAIAGESAGGYLACMTAMTTDEEFMGVPFIGEEQSDRPVSAEVEALIDFYGCIQFSTFEEEFQELKVPKWVRQIANNWIETIMDGTEASSIEELWIGKNLSSMSKEELETYQIPYYAKKNKDSMKDLNVIILHGDADLTVPYLQSSNLYELITSLNGEEHVTYRLFPNYGHASDGFYLDETLSWILEEIGW